MQSYRKQSSVPHSPVASAYLPASLAINEPATLDSLLRAAELTLYRRINSVINMLPVPHQVCVLPVQVCVLPVPHQVCVLPVPHQVCVLPEWF